MKYTTIVARPVCESCGYVFEDRHNIDLYCNKASGCAVDEKKRKKRDNDR